jgi:hypothetical protein
MASVTFQCGHIGFASGSPQRLARIQTGLCNACWLKQQPVVFVISADSVYVTRGYPIRAELQARDYWFQRPNWKRRFATGAERAQEIAWIEASGFTLEYEKAKPENRRKKGRPERAEI